MLVEIHPWLLRRSKASSLRRLQGIFSIPCNVGNPHKLPHQTKRRSHQVPAKVMPHSRRLHHPTKFYRILGRETTSLRIDAGHFSSFFYDICLLISREPALPKFVFSYGFATHRHLVRASWYLPLRYCSSLYLQDIYYCLLWVPTIMSHVLFKYMYVPELKVYSLHVGGR